MTLRELSAAIYEAERALELAIKERIKPRTWVGVTSGENVTEVMVVSTCGNRVTVYNPVSEKEYSVYAFRLAEFETW